MMSRRRVILVTTGLLAVIAVLLGVGFSSGGFSMRTPQSHQAADADAKADAEAEAEEPVAELVLPSPSPEPLGDEAVAAESAGAAVTSLIDANNQILQRADGGTVGLENVAAGFVWGELQALATERAQLGYRQVGEATVTSTTVRSSDLTGAPPTIVLDVCIDATAVDIVDENGTSMKDRLYNPGVPVLHVYGAQYIDGLWKLTTHDIPDGGSCAG